MSWITHPRSDKRTDAKCFESTLDALLEVNRISAWMDDPTRFIDQPAVRNELNAATNALHDALDHYEQAQLLIKATDDRRRTSGS